MYTAGDLKLLTTLASQSAPAIDNALLHEKTLHKAREREERLRRQIEDLRIELDEVRQEEKVTEIVETEYFKRLRDQSNDLRRIIDGDAIERTRQRCATRSVMNLSCHIGHGR